MRVLYDRNTCVMCNISLRQVIIVPLRHFRLGMTFEDAMGLPGAFHDKEVEMWFIDRARHQQLKNVRGWKCSHKTCNTKGQKDSVFANSTQLRAHARSEHRSIYCDICFTGKKSFVSEINLYSLDNGKTFSSKLRGHLRKEHPQCRFCRRYYLDDEKLYAHLQESHEACSVCERSGRLHEYYVNFEQLERHYEEEHYICHHESCRGVVFATQIELQSHEHSQHSDSSRGSRSRTLRVNLQQLHGVRDSQRPDPSMPVDVRIEQERQAARRRAFLSSAVVFSGAFDVEDTSANPTPAGSSHGPPPEAPQPHGSASTESASKGGASASKDVTEQTRPPDDGHFHPLALPRDGEEITSRNTVLIRSMRSLLDPAAYEQFRQSSSEFHSGKITPDDYFDAAVDAFGIRAAVRDILPELVALLPSPLLREPLLQVCLKKTDTKASDGGYLGSSGPVVTGRASSSGEKRGDEQFPTLNGVPTPTRVNPKARRFGAPGPEEFPRLGRVNKTQQAIDPAPTPSQASPSQSMVEPKAPKKDNAPKSQRTAASILKHPVPAKRIFGKQQGGSAASSNNSSAGPRLATSAFPSLSTAPTPTVSKPTDSQGSNQGGAALQTGEHVPTDVSMRVGAVWGGATAQSLSRGNKMRGPGRGQRRRPATPPRCVVTKESGSGSKSESEFPQMQTSAPSNAVVGSSSGPSQVTPRGSKVIDVVEISKARRDAVAKSSLPKIGGSGYGFAWDRKKAQKKKKQIKNDVTSNSENKTELRTPYSFSSSNSVRIAGGQERTDSKQSSGAGAAAEIGEKLEDTHIESSNCGTSQGGGVDAFFDPYSYLKDDSAKDEGVASFLRSTK